MSKPKEPLSQRQIADILGMSQQWVNKVEQRALDKLRALLAERGLDRDLL